jgi:hypothetical protein
LNPADESIEVVPDFLKLFAILPIFDFFKVLPWSFAFFELTKGVGCLKNSDRTG